MDLKRKNEGLTKSSSDQFTWLKQMWKYCNQETRRDIKAAIEIPKGTLSSEVSEILQGSTSAIHQLLQMPPEAQEI